MKEIPLLNALIEFVNRETTSFHVPGHKNGKHSFIKELSLPNILHYDVTELNGLDDLHYPTEVIKEAETRLSEVYGANESFFLVNGSTVGNLASILTLCGENDEVLVQRNCHKSVFHGLFIAGSKPVFLPLDIDLELGQPLGINIDQSIKILKKFSNAKAVILTNPNYYGMSQDLTEIIDLAHTMRIPVIVDEAHGTHFTIGEPFPKEALSMGADIVVQSAHKTLPAMTMGSYLHIKSKLVNCDKIRDMLRVLQSSSPSYPIMASLDYSRYFVENFNFDQLNQLHEHIKQFIKQLQELPNIEVVTTSNLSYKQDLLKLIIKSTLGQTGKQLQEIFEKEGIFVELSDWGHILLILPLDAEVDFSEQFIKIQRATSNLTKIKNEYPKIEVPNLESVVSESYATLKKKQKLLMNLIESAGEISAENIVPYPPGVPILLKGEVITKAHIDYILEIYQYGLTIHNLIENKNLQIEVFI
jgi:arginine decarboxylase